MPPHRRKRTHIDTRFQVVSSQQRPKGLIRAYVFVGRTAKVREKKAYAVSHWDEMYMFGVLHNRTRTKTALYFTSEHSANPTTFEMVKAWAGEADCTGIYTQEWKRFWHVADPHLRFGIVDLDKRKIEKHADKLHTSKG